MNIDEIEKVVRALANAVRGRKVGTLLSDGMSGQELRVARANSGWKGLVKKLKAEGIFLNNTRVINGSVK